MGLSILLIIYSYFPWVECDYNTLSYGERILPPDSFLAQDSAKFSSYIS